MVFSYLTQQAVHRSKSVLVLTNRGELLRQAGGAFSEFGINAEYFEQGVYPDLSKRVHVAMINTFLNRIDELIDFLLSRDLIIIDEAHLQDFNKLLDLIPRSQIVIGATATPIRKGKERCLSVDYDAIIQEIDTPELLELGKLTPAISYGVEIDTKGLRKSGDDYDTRKYYDDNKTYKGVVWNYEQLSKGEKTILFASNISSSKQVCDEFVAAGYNAKHVDGKSKNRKEIFEWFDKTDDAILCNCGIATTGFDQDDILTVILYRATTSLALFLQMCGRGSRLLKKHRSIEKPHFKILDFGNNIKRHGLWQQPRSWTLTKPDKPLGAAAVKICPSCSAMNYASATECVVCLAKFPVPKKALTPDEVILKLIEDNGIRGRKLSSLNVDQLIILQKGKVFKAGYIWRIVRALNVVREYGKKMNYSNGWIYRQESERIEETKDGKKIEFKDKVL